MTDILGILGATTSTYSLNPHSAFTICDGADGDLAVDVEYTLGEFGRGRVLSEGPGGGPPHTFISSAHAVQVV